MTFLGDLGCSKSSEFVRSQIPFPMVKCYFDKWQANTFAITLRCDKLLKLVFWVVSTQATIGKSVELNDELSVGLTEDKLFVVGSEKLLDVNQRLNRLALIGFDSIVIILVVQVWHQGDRRGEPHVGHSARRRSQPHVHAQFPLTAPWGLRHTCPAHHRPHDAGNHSASWRGKAKPTRWVTGN